MTLYEIDQMLLSCIDEETGEVIDFETLDQLQMERAKKIENIALLIKNKKSDALAIKAELDALTQRLRMEQNQIKRLEEYEIYALKGEKFSSPRVVCSYRKSTATVIENEEQLISWAKQNNETLIEYPAPKIKRTEVKKAIQGGEVIPFATLEERQSLQIN